MSIPTAHELREYISFRNVTVPYDAGTQAGTESSVFATTWARIADLGGNVEPITQQHQQQTQQFEVWCRYIEGITGFMEIEWGTRVLTITGPPQKFMDNHARLWWIIRAEEAVERSLP